MFFLKNLNKKKTVGSYSTNNFVFKPKNYEDIKMGDIIRKMKSIDGNKQTQMFKLVDLKREYTSDWGSQVIYSKSSYIGKEVDNNLNLKLNGETKKFQISGMDDFMYGMDGLLGCAVEKMFVGTFDVLEKKDN